MTDLIDPFPISVRNAVVLAILLNTDSPQPTAHYMPPQAMIVQTALYSHIVCQLWWLP